MALLTSSTSLLPWLDRATPAIVGQDMNPVEGGRGGRSSEEERMGVTEDAGAGRPLHGLRPGHRGDLASGVTEMLGTVCKPLHPGKAAMHGVAAALLASRGFDSSPRVLDAPKGFGTRTNPFVLVPTGKREPRTGLEGKFSMFRCAAVALIYGAARAAKFTDARVNAPAVVELRGRVMIQPEESMAMDETRVAIPSEGRSLPGDPCGARPRDRAEPHERPGDAGEVPGSGRARAGPATGAARCGSGGPAGVAA